MESVASSLTAASWTPSERFNCFLSLETSLLEKKEDVEGWGGESYD